MDMLEEMQGWEGKPKELVAHLTQKIVDDHQQFNQLMECLRSGTDVEKGTCADVIKHVSKEAPDLVAPHIDELIRYVNYKAPRVRWGIPEDIGSIAATHPREAAKAVPSLLRNTEDSSTVVRWCAAYALTQIAQNSHQAALTDKIKELAEKEQNSGVKNLYQKTLKPQTKNR